MRHCQDNVKLLPAKFLPKAQATNQGQNESQSVLPDSLDHSSVDPIIPL